MTYYDSSMLNHYCRAISDLLLINYRFHQHISRRSIMIVLPTKSDERLLQIVRIVILGLKIIGLAPFSIRQTKNLSRNTRDSWFCNVFIFSKIGLAYNVSLAILFLVMSALGIPYVSSVNYREKFSITQAIDVSEAILGIAVSCVIIVSVGLKQKKAISIMNRLLEVDCLLSDIRKYPRSKRISLIFLTVQTIFNVLLWVTFWATEQTFPIVFLVGSIYNAPLFIIFYFFVEYSIVLALLTSEFENLNTNLANFQEFSNNIFRVSIQNDLNGLSGLSLQTHRSQLATLKVLRNIRITLSKVSEDVTDFFSISILFSIGHVSIVLVYNTYYLITTIIFRNGYSSSLSDIINTVMWILICFYPLILLSFNVTQTLKEAKRTRPIIHKALARTKYPDIEKELERFSLQLTDENLSFTAHGFFSLDFTLIQSILGTTATYLVIMIQFMQSAADTPKDAGF